MPPPRRDPPHKQMWTVLLGCLGLLVSIHPLHRCDAEARRCPKGWMTYENDCYGIFRGKRTWREAEKNCRSRGKGGQLASILEVEGTKYVALYINYSFKMNDLGPVWIGMFYKNSPEGDWWWTDASKTFYIKWMKGWPKASGKRKYCVYLEEEEYKYWKETDCNRRFAYLCKYAIK